MPEQLAAKLPALKQLSEVTSQDLFLAEVLRQIGLLVRQGELLAAHYDVVVMNPPYMGSGSMNALLKKFAKDHFPSARSDLFACFIERSYSLAKNLGNIAMVTMRKSCSSLHTRGCVSDCFERRPSQRWRKLDTTASHR